MKKYFLSALIMMSVSCVAFGQTTKQKLEPVKSNPATTTNAAKADAQLINKNNVSDSTTIKLSALKNKQQGRKLKKKKTSTQTSL